MKIKKTHWMRRCVQTFGLYCISTYALCLCKIRKVWDFSWHSYQKTYNFQTGFSRQIYFVCGGCAVMLSAHQKSASNILHWSMSRATGSVGPFLYTVYGQHRLFKVFWKILRNMGFLPKCPKITWMYRCTLYGTHRTFFAGEINDYFHWILGVLFIAFNNVF